MNFTKKADGAGLKSRTSAGAIIAPAQACLPALAAVALLLAAPTFALTSWLLADDHPAILFYAFPVVAAEIAVIILAVAAGFDLRAGFLRLHPTTRIGAGVWLAAILCANLIIAPARAAAIPLLFTTLVHAGFALALWSLLTSRWTSRKKDFLRCTAAGVGLFGVIFAAVMLAELDNPAFDWLGVGVGITNIRQLGFYGITLVGIALGLGAPTRGWHWVLAAAGTALGFWLTILSGSRVAFVAAIIASVVIGVLSDREHRTSLAMLVTLALAAAIPASYLLIPHESWGFDRIIDRSFSGDSAGDYTSGRLAIWKETWAAILESPLLGHGEGQFRSQIVSAGNGLNHPHNAFLQLLYQWGLIGTSALALMLASTVRNLRSTARGDIFLASIGAAVGLLAMAMLEGSLYHAYPVMIVVLCLVVLNATATSTPTEPQTPAEPGRHWAPDQAALGK